MAPPARKGRRPSAQRRQPASSPPLTVTVAEVGARGDGLAEADGQRLYIPFVLPGETVTVRPGPPRGDGREATLVSVDAPSAERVTPPCPAFGLCGGCALQHWSPDGELRWKGEQVRLALARRGLSPEGFAPPVAVGGGSRRRVTLAYDKDGNAPPRLGFHARGTHRLVPLPPQGCAVLDPGLAAALPALAEAIAPALPVGARGDVHLTLCDDGLDVRLDLAASPALAAREALAAAAETLDLARLVVRSGDLDEPLAVRRPPHAQLSGRRVPMPAGGFLQPSRAGEAALQKLVLAGLTEAGLPPGAAVLDLFCGLGTFAVPLALAGYALTAVDAAPEAISALNGAMGRAGVQAIKRDLFTLPYLGPELAPFAAVVFDPPRAGAREQAEALAMGGPPAVVGVSCNPATFARDARILADGGYRLRRVTPVDQFAWTAHVELVAVFTRNG